MSEGRQLFSLLRHGDQPGAWEPDRPMSPQVGAMGAIRGVNDAGTILIFVIPGSTLDCNVGRTQKERLQ